ncbi:MAG: phosphoglycerate dehydrogenase [Planctomycetes bacterium]|nr:phosphoglycerate dehydrogenase [Planctomycetota bacterium]
MKPTVIITESLASEPAHWLAQHCQVVEGSPESHEFKGNCARAQGLAIRTATRIDQHILSRLPELKVIARAGVGLDHIDLAACKARGVRVVHTPDANTQAVVEYVLALMLDSVRPRIFLDAPVDSKHWEALRDECTGARQLDEMTVGILGLGRIGSRLARVLHAMGCTVIYHDLIEIDAARRFGARSVSVEELFADSDVLSIHVDGRESNRGFINQGRIRRMKPDATFINTSRGRVVDHAALAEFLKAHPRAKCMLDVHDPEPFLPTSPLLGLANARLAPHLASRTRTAVRNMSWVVRDLVAVLRGEEPKHEA